MDNIWIYSLVSVLLVSMASLIGIVLLVLNKDFFEKVQSLLVSFAIGTMLGGAIVHLLPESLEHDHTRIRSLFVVISIIVFFVLEKVLNIYHKQTHTESNIKTFGVLNLIADSLHNFIDGVLIAAAFLIDISTGIVATIAVLAHELPQEFGDFAVLMKAGFTRKKALLFNLLSALSAVLGAVIVLIFPHLRTELSGYILPFAAGGFLYIALADLLPELQKKNSIKGSFFQFLFIVFGVGLMWVLTGLHIGHQH